MHLARCAVLVQVVRTSRDREHVPVGAERKRTDRRRQHILPDPLLGDRVPKRTMRVAAARRKRSIPRIKGKRVDREHHVLAIDLLAVAFEGVLLCLALGARVEELNRDAALDRRGRVADALRHAPHVAEHKFQRALARLLGLRRVFELVGIECIAHRAQVVDMHEPLSHSDDKARRRVLGLDGWRAGIDRDGVHGKHLVRQRNGVPKCLVRLREGVPELERGVPGPRNEQLCGVVVAYAAYAVLVLADDHGLPCLEIESGVSGVSTYNRTRRSRHALAASDSLIQHTSSTAAGCSKVCRTRTPLGPWSH